jgi:phosphatidate phosphatase APP1
VTPAGSRAAAVAYRLERRAHLAMARLAVRGGWAPALLPYPGYGGSGRVRVLARVLLAPAGTDPGARRGLPGWQRFLTLEWPDAEVEVEVAGVRAATSSDASGLVDSALAAHPPPGPAVARLATGGRGVAATVHVAADTAAVGIVCDIDDTVWITELHHPLRAAWRTLRHSSGGRQPVPGMAALLAWLHAQHPGAPVIYLSNGPWNLAGPVERFLERHGFPPGALLMTDWGLTPRGWFRDGRAHKAGALRRVSADLPSVRWVLVGDDGEHDPDLYAAFAAEHPDRVAAIALRQVSVDPRTGLGVPARPAGDVPVVAAPDGEELLQQLRRALE